MNMPAYLFFLSILTTLLLFRPLPAVLHRIDKRGFFYYRRRGRRLFIHMNPWARTATFSTRQLRAQKKSLVLAIAEALQDGHGVVVLASHLLTPTRIQALRQHFSHCYCHMRVLPRITPGYECWGIRLEILLKEWRWPVIGSTGYCVVFKRRREEVTS